MSDYYELVARLRDGRRINRVEPADRLEHLEAAGERLMATTAPRVSDTAAIEARRAWRALVPAAGDDHE